MRTPTAELYNATIGAVKYIEEHLENCGDMVFGPSRASEIVLSEVINRGLHSGKDIFCDNERVYNKMKNIYPGAKIERVSTEDIKPKRKVNYTYLYVDGVDAYTDSRIVLVGSDPKMYDTATLESVKKMGYYAIPFLALADIHDRACLGGFDAAVKCIGSNDLPIPIEVAKGSEHNVRRFLSNLLAEDFGADAKINSLRIYGATKADGYPRNDRSVMGLSFPESSVDMTLLEHEALKHPHIKSIGVHAKKRPDILIIGEERGFETNEMKYHPLSPGRIFED